jgi:hypothetical protein
MAIFTTFPSLLAIEILGNGPFRSLKVDFAFVNRKNKYLNFLSKFNKYFTRRILDTNSYLKFKIAKKGYWKNPKHYIIANNTLKCLRFCASKSV